MSDADRIRDYFGSTSWRPSPARTQIADERRALLADLGGSFGTALADLAVCDVGCGDGADLRSWRDAGVPENQLAGTELVEARAAIAQQAVPTADIRVVDGVELPFHDEAFDICSASLVLSAITTDVGRKRLLREMARVTRPGGAVAVYDFTIRKPWNRNVRSVTTGHLTALWRRPDTIRRAAPFLPILEVVSRLPDRIRGPLTGVLPRTHRLWVWRIT